jgi:hypothetical protein
MMIAPAPPFGIVGRLEAQQTDGNTKTRASNQFVGHINDILLLLRQQTSLVICISLKNTRRQYCAIFQQDDQTSPVCKIS